MREQLIQYVDLLFAGAADTEDIKQEILQNTLDRYDDLVSQGKSPEAAYSLAISGIGDVSELLRKAPTPTVSAAPDKVTPAQKPLWKTVFRAFAIFLYIICPIPLFVLSEFGMETLGLCGTLGIVGLATALMIFAGDKSRSKNNQEEKGLPLTPQQELHKAASSLVGILTLVIYLLISFITGEWWITWLVFPVSAALKGLIKACIDVKKVSKRNAIGRIVLYCITILLLLAILCSCLGLGALMFHIDLGTGNYTSGGASVSASLVQNLEIEWAAGSVTIVTADTDTISFSEAGTGTSKYTMAYSLDGETLSLVYAKGNFTISFGSMPSKDLTITVPESWYCKSLEIDGAALEISITDLSADSIELDGMAMELSFSGTVNSLDCDGAACDLELTCKATPQEISIDGASCDLDMTLPAGCGFLVQMDGLGCNFHSDLDYTRSNGDYLYGDRACKVNADGLSCNVTIRESK